MQAMKNYVSSDISQRINDCAIAILKSTPGLSKFRMKLKIESQSKYKITIHANYEGQDLCSSEIGFDIWRTFKSAETKFFKSIRRAKLTKISKIKKNRIEFKKYQGGYDDVDDTTTTTI